MIFSPRSFAQCERLTAMASAPRRVPPEHRALTGSGKLAQQMQEKALQILRNGRRIKLSKEASQPLAQLNHVMELMLAIRFNAPSLDPMLRELDSIVEKYRVHMDKTQSHLWPNILQRFDKDRDLSTILVELRNALGALEKTKHLDVGRKFHFLLGKAYPAPEAYSNADLARFFNDNFQQWSTTYERVNIWKDYARICKTIENEEGCRIKLEITLETDFEAACFELVNNLWLYSLPVEEVFPRSSAKPGVIRLDTDANSSESTILWACHNVFVRADLEDGESTVPSRPNRSELFYSLTDKMFQYILDGCLPEQKNLTRPKIQKISYTDDIVYVGEPFKVNITAEPKRLHQVECRDSKLIYDDWAVNESLYTFTFTPMERGEASVHFHFADPNTFNFASVRFMTLVKPPRNRAEAEASS
ncbi:hypothetical protein F5Y10DRAFT_264042 [Nemania abortiva]|nr:hypothetical protein F5Y10DRAFT_264042 [Nemania abortiva]